MIQSMVVSLLMLAAVCLGFTGAIASLMSDLRSNVLTNTTNVMRKAMTPHLKISR